MKHGKFCGCATCKPPPAGMATLRSHEPQPMGKLRREDRERSTVEREHVGTFYSRSVAGKQYTVYQSRKDGALECTCAGFTENRGRCSHVQAAMRDPRVRMRRERGKLGQKPF
jgi:hypothetical protein